MLGMCQMLIRSGILEEPYHSLLTDIVNRSEISEEELQQTILMLQTDFVWLTQEEYKTLIQNQK